MDRTTDTARPVDGRTARRDRNRMAVLDAVLELFAEGNLDPGVHEVAERSGVSLRSVYRYFEDLDELVTAAIEQHFQRTRPLFEIDRLGEGPLAERVQRFAECRVRLFDAARTIYRASRVRAANDPDVQRDLLATQQWLADQTQAMFAPELRALDEPECTDTERTLDVLTQFDALDHLRHRCGLAHDEAVAYLQRILHRLLSPV
jgi:AcrR family transcriptional regulator